MERRMTADYLFINGNFITLNEEHPRASAMAVKDGRIIEIGSYEDVKIHLGKGTKSLDLVGKTVVPGFIDSHIHLISLGLDMQVLDLEGVTSKSDLLGKLSAAENTPSGNWIKGYGFEESMLEELPTRDKLDSLFPDNPVYLEEKGSKMCVANSLALRKTSEKEVEGTILEKNGSGSTGVIRVDVESLLYKAIDVPTLDPVDNYLRESELELAIEIASKSVVKAGITSIHDPQLPPNALRAFKNAVRDGRTPLRLYLGCDKNKDIGLETYVQEGLGTEPYPLRLKMGIVKLFADDRISSTEFKKRVKEAHSAGFQLAIHATNMEEMKTTLEALEGALGDAPRDGHRHRIEHADNIDKGLLGRARKLNLIVAAQPEIIYKLEPEYPEDVMKVPYSSLSRAGINVSGGSDSPTVPIKRRARPPLAYPTPLIGICFAVSRKTMNGRLIDEGESVSVLADFAVLSDNPFKVNPDYIKYIKVEKTVIGGEIV
jgi:predicted amidohydrolase YtcJ